MGAPWKRRFLLETIISRFHVNFWGCILIFLPTTRVLKIIWFLLVTLHICQKSQIMNSSRHVSHVILLTEKSCFTQQPSTKNLLNPRFQNQWAVFISPRRDEILPSYISGLFHKPWNKDPYQPTRISWNVNRLWFTLLRWFKGPKNQTLSPNVGLVTKPTTFEGVTGSFPAQTGHENAELPGSPLKGNIPKKYRSLGVAPSQDSSDHQNYYIFSRESQPKPSFPTVTGRGPHPNSTHAI